MKKANTDRKRDRPDHAGGARLAVGSIGLAVHSARDGLSLRHGGAASLPGGTRGGSWQGEFEVRNERWGLRRDGQAAEYASVLRHG